MGGSNSTPFKSGFGGSSFMLMGTISCRSMSPVPVKSSMYVSLDSGGSTGF